MTKHGAFVRSGLALGFLLGLGLAPARAAALSTLAEGGSGLELVALPGGCFQMGSPVGEIEHGPEEALHEVCLDPFLIGKYEVTVAEFRKFVAATGYQTEAEKGDGCWVMWGAYPDTVAGKSWRDPGFRQGDQEPVVCVSWNDTQAYLAWLGQHHGRSYRLPTEAEWEYAARGGTGTARYWGDDPHQACGYANVYDWRSDLVNACDLLSHNCNDGQVYTAPVGRFKPNGFGLYDMLGNVWEWNQDWYDKEYYATGPNRNPTGPETGKVRGFRGGAWFARLGLVRSASRYGLQPDRRVNGLGFRVVSPLGK